MTFAKSAMQCKLGKGKNLKKEENKMTAKNIIENLRAETAFTFADPKNPTKAKYSDQQYQTEAIVTAGMKLAEAVQTLTSVIIDLKG